MSLALHLETKVTMASWRLSIGEFDGTNTPIWRRVSLLAVRQSRVV